MKVVNKVEGTDLVQNIDNILSTKNGALFCLDDLSWTLSDATSTSVFNFERLGNCLTYELMSALKKTLKWYLENKSLSHSFNLYVAFVSFADDIKKNIKLITTIRPEDILNWNASLPEEESYRMRDVKILLKKWKLLGYGGVDKDCLLLLNQIRPKANEKGKAVRTLDPLKGPLSKIELDNVFAALNNKLATDDISISDYLLLDLTICFAPRSTQLALLKCSDLKVGYSKDGEKEYLLYVPSIKKRTQEYRQQFKIRYLSSDAGELLEEEISRIMQMAPELGLKLEEMPIFLNLGSIGFPNFPHHFQGGDIGNKIKKICSSFNIISERTGEKLKITPRRFRYSYATRMVEEGYGALAIAEALDHEDTTNVQVYLESTSVIAVNIDKAMAFELAPLAQAFLGLVIDQDYERSDEKTISEPELGDIGLCGKYGFCGSAAPIACFTCLNFHPWKDGPHEGLLDFLLKEKDRLFKITGDEKISSVNDRTMMAVAEVIRRCNPEKYKGHEDV